jgi:hypothetical protein
LELDLEHYEVPTPNYEYAANKAEDPRCIYRVPSSMSSCKEDGSSQVFKTNQVFCGLLYFKALNDNA